MFGVVSFIFCILRSACTIAITLTQGTLGVIITSLLPQNVIVTFWRNNDNICPLSRFLNALILSLEPEIHIYNINHICVYIFRRAVSHGTQRSKVSCCRLSTMVISSYSCQGATWRNASVEKWCLDWVLSCQESSICWCLLWRVMEWPHSGLWGYSVGLRL